jgi:transcriptional regulator with XRE-family HTH domain
MTQPALAEMLNFYLRRLDRNASWLAERLKLSPSTVTRWLNGESRPAKAVVIQQLIEVLEIDTPHERQELYRAAGFGADYPGAGSAAPSALEEPVQTSSEPASRRRWLMPGVILVVVGVVAAGFLLPTALRSPNPNEVEPPPGAMTELAPAATLSSPTQVAEPTTMTASLVTPPSGAVTMIITAQNFFNAPIEAMSLTQTTIYQGDPPDVRQAKAEQRAALVAAEIRYYLAHVDARLGLVESVLAANATVDDHGAALREVRATLVPALQTVATAGYQQLIAAQQVSGLRAQLNSYPLLDQPNSFVLEAAADSGADPDEVRAFYAALGEVQAVTEDLFHTLDEYGAITGRALTDPASEGWVAFAHQKLALAGERLRNRSSLAHVAGLRILNDLLPAHPPTELPEIQHLAPRQVVDDATLDQLLLPLVEAGEAVARRRQALLEQGEQLLAEDVAAYAALDETLRIQPGDPWNVVVGKAITLRQFGRIEDAVAAFDQYAEMFAADDPTAIQYAQIARQFTLQMKTLGIVEGAVYVYEVAPGSAAAHAGVTVGDILVELAGQPTPRMEAMTAALEAVTTAETIEVVVLRWEADGRFRRLSLTLDGPPPLGIGFMPI